MIQWLEGERRFLYGYTDLGSIQIPVLPQYLALKDRDDGTLWYLQHTLTPAGPDGNGYVSISNVRPANPDIVTFEAYEGPILGTSPMLRLLIRGGRLGYEQYVDGRAATDYSPPIRTRRQKYAETRLIYKPTWWVEKHIDASAAMSDELVWTPQNI